MHFSVVQPIYGTYCPLLIDCNGLRINCRDSSFVKSAFMKSKSDLLQSKRLETNKLWSPESVNVCRMRFWFQKRGSGQFRSDVQGSRSRTFFWRWHNELRTSRIRYRHNYLRTCRGARWMHLNCFRWSDESKKKKRDRWMLHELNDSQRNRCFEVLSTSLRNHSDLFLDCVCVQYMSY